MSVRDTVCAHAPRGFSRRGLTIQAECEPDPALTHSQHHGPNRYLPQDDLGNAASRVIRTPTSVQLATAALASRRRFGGARTAHRKLGLHFANDRSGTGLRSNRAKWGLRSPQPVFVACYRTLWCMG